MKSRRVKYYIFLFLSLALGSCVQVYYVEPQYFNGVQVQEFPIKMRGSWMDQKDGVRITTNSIESIEIKKDTLGNLTDTLFQRNTLGDSLKIYQDNKILFVNYRAESPYWELAIIKINNNGTISVYDCRDAHLIVKDKNIKLEEALFVKVEEDTTIETRVKSLNTPGEGEYQHKHTLFSGQLSAKSLRKITKRENLVIKLKKDGTID